MVCLGGRHRLGRGWGVICSSCDSGPKPDVPGLRVRGLDLLGVGLALTEPLRWDPGQRDDGPAAEAVRGWGLGTGSWPAGMASPAAPGPPIREKEGRGPHFLLLFTRAEFLNPIVE